MNVEVGREGGPKLYDSNVRSLAQRMVLAGQLGRTGEPFKGNVRYRYSRRRGLEGPIADLERAYHHDDE